MAVKFLGAAKYILKGENTWIEPDEAWFSIVDAGGAQLCRVPMSPAQADMCAKENRLTAISPVQYFALIRENA